MEIVSSGIDTTPTPINKTKTDDNDSNTSSDSDSEKGYIDTKETPSMNKYMKRTPLSRKSDLSKNKKLKSGEADVYVKKDRKSSQLLAGRSDW